MRRRVLWCRGNERELMQERADVAERRAATTANVAVLGQAMEQLLRLPAELGGGGGSGSGGAGSASGARHGSSAASGSGRDASTGALQPYSSSRLGGVRHDAGSAPALEGQGSGGNGTESEKGASLAEAAAVSAQVSPTRRRGSSAASGGGADVAGGGGGGSAARDAAQVAARGLEVYRGLNVSSVGMRSATARPVRGRSGELDGAD